MLEEHTIPSETHVTRFRAVRPGRVVPRECSALVQDVTAGLDYGVVMSQPTQTPSPLTARLYDLEYPRSLGVYSTYQEVQAVVDTLADNQFPVQSTLIVGTDLKLMERVTGRKTWGRVIGQGVMSGLWMGLFLGLLFMLISPANFGMILISVLMGIVFFTVWSVIGYAMTGGKRDFTSIVATVPMQYELLVEHKHAEAARRLLAENGSTPPPPAGHTSLPGAQQPVAGGHPAAPPARPGAPSYGQPAPTQAPAPQTEQSPAVRNRPSFGQPAPTQAPVGQPGASQQQPPAPQQSPAQPPSAQQSPTQPPSTQPSPVVPPGSRGDGTGEQR